MNVTKVGKEDFTEWIDMGCELHSFLDTKCLKKDIEKEFMRIFDSKKEETFICKDDKSDYLGYVNVSIRHDYVEGSKTNPVGYIESIFVKNKSRKKGIGRALVQKAEEWIINNGCSEVGSDADLSNLNSQKFHEEIGFKEIEKIVHFIKKIK